MMRVSSLMILVSCAVVVYGTQYDYEGYHVFRLRPKTVKQNNVLLKLSKGNHDLDFWTVPNKLDIPVDVLVMPKDQLKFLRLINRHQIQYKVLNNHVKRLLKEYRKNKNINNKFDWKSYGSLHDIYGWMDTLPDDKVEILTVGTTNEGRIIKGLKISFGSGRRAVFLEGGIHAREWISPATVTYIANELLFSKDPALRKIAESFDWYVVPVLNPDGYVMSHDYFRMWRKTTKSYPPCIGADINRNFEYYWGAEGTSNNTCSDSYGGPEPFSEIEALSYSRFVSSVAPRLDAYLAFHSYSQLILLPYGHTKDHLDNYDDIFHISKKGAEALEKRYGTKYKIGNSAEAIYEATGLSMDYVKAKFKIPFVITYEMRDTGDSGFLLPAEQIIPNCEEVVDSIVAMFQEAEKLGYFKLRDLKFTPSYFRPQHFKALANRTLYGD